MAEIFPFSALRYNAARVKLDDVLTQPYDKITAEMQERYYARSPFNLIPIEKGRALPDDSPGNSVYTRAAETLKVWIGDGILVREPSPAIYVYFQNFLVPGAQERRTRKGFIALGRIHDYADGVVFRHEQTHSGPKADRLELLRHTRCHSGQLFMLYSDPARRIDALLDQVARVPPPIEVRDEFGVIHRLWPVLDAEAIERFRREMADQKLVIADGHHRYETALAFRDECRAGLAKPDPDAPYEKVMMTFVNACTEGLVILPTHRLISGLTDFRFAALREQLAPWFDWSSYPFGKDSERAANLPHFRATLERRGRERPAIGAYAKGGALSLFLLRPDTDLEKLLPDVTPTQRDLDVVLLHRLILERALGITADAVRQGRQVAYEREVEAAVTAVDGGAAQVSFLLNPVGVERVVQMALAGEVLPQKSTDFYPKLLSGMTIYRLDG